MKDADFQQLLASVKEAGRIKRGEQEPARKFEVRKEDVRAIRSKLGKSQSASRIGNKGGVNRKVRRGRS